MKLPLHFYEQVAPGAFGVRDANGERQAFSLAKKDAEFIALACNSHDQLVAALRDLLPRVRNLEDSGPVGDGEGYQSDELETAIQAADAALAAAGE